ncbi:MAG: hypothetical protein ACTHMM_08905 [Agriterribacter sp.]
MVNVDICQTKEGIIHLITSSLGFDFSTSQIDYNNQTLLALGVYQGGGDFNTGYLLLKDDMQPDYVEHLGEQYPTLIKGPRGEILIAIEKGTGSTRQAFISKLFPKSGEQKAVITKPFGEGFLGFVDNAGYYCRGRRLHRVDFQNGMITVQRNKIFKNTTWAILFNDQIHILEEEKENNLLHTQLDQNYKKVSSRQLVVPEFEYLEIINLAMNEPSKMVTSRENNKEISLWTVDQNNTLNMEVLFTVPSEITHLQKLSILNSGAVLFEFMSENERGWFIIKEDRLLEYFIEKDTGFQSLLSEEFIHLGEDEWAIMGANPTTGNSYSLTFVPLPEDTEPIDKIIVLTRQHP